MKIGYLAAILKRCKYFIFFSWNMVVISVYTYGVKIIGKFWWESGFLWEVPWNPPYALTEVQGTLCSYVLKGALGKLSLEISLLEKHISLLYNIHFYWSSALESLSQLFSQTSQEKEIYLYSFFFHLFFLPKSDQCLVSDLAVWYFKYLLACKFLYPTLQN